MWGLLFTEDGFRGGSMPKLTEIERNQLNLIQNYFPFKNLVKYVINGANLVKIDHFWWKLSKSGHFGIFWAPKRRHMSKSGEFFSLTFSKIISVRFMYINLVKNVINVINLVKICHFWWKWAKIGGQNDVKMTKVVK